jgi:hypothetical protein
MKKKIKQKFLVLIEKEFEILEIFLKYLKIIIKNKFSITENLL